MAKVNPIELQSALKGAEYPTTREQLAEVAQHNKADPKLVEKIRKAPHERYEGPNEVSKDFGGR